MRYTAWPDWSTSAKALTWPMFAMVCVALAKPIQPVTMPLVLGIGLAQLGTVLILAGIFAGTFRVFGLQRRGLVLLVGVLVAVAGGLLSI